MPRLWKKSCSKIGGSMSDNNSGKCGQTLGWFNPEEIDRLKAENEQLKKQLADSWTDDFVNKIKKNWRDEVDKLTKENYELRLEHSIYNPCSMYAHINAENISKERDNLRQLLEEARAWIERASFSMPMSNQPDILTKLTAAIKGE